ncbi:TetR/AcrR family transcriptional regulator [Streptosporangium sp. NPDC023615]|uniref:TetR/AcrR family transcriptional regulator n=1 Tax=Streptosporangium sp. NPDC023615 TaxID=3154794 RepID=UPI0034378AE1
MTAQEDPDRTVELLWREPWDATSRQGLSIGAIVRAAVEIADAEGIEALSMRRVGERLGFTGMSLYRHVRGKTQLVDLMCDAVLGETVTGTVTGAGTVTVTGAGAETESPAGRSRPGDPGDPGGSGGSAGPGGWREALEAWARRYRALCHRHPWLAGVHGTRYVPGPNSVAGFEHALATVAGTGLSPAEMVAVVGLVGRFVEGEALREAEVARIERRTEVSEQDWWGARESLFAELSRYPTLTAVWEAGGYDEPEDPFEFGLRRVLDGIEVLVRQRDERRDEIASCVVCGATVDRSGTGRPRAYCSRGCQQRAYRRRRSGPQGGIRQ